MKSTEPVPVFILKSTAGQPVGRMILGTDNHIDSHGAKPANEHIRINASGCDICKSSNMHPGTDPYPAAEMNR